MQDDILKEVLHRIVPEFGFKKNGDWLQQGKCPRCGKKEMFASAKGPWILRCGRSNRCGEEISVKDTYPDLFDTWSNRYQQTDADPNAAADAYLYHNRKISLTGLRGCYSQEIYFDKDRNISSATIRFPLANGSWWERIIDQPGRFDKKARFKYGAPYGGYWWHAPDQDVAALKNAGDIWIAEGIFDALALRQAGLFAVSAMSVNNYPEKSLAELRKACGEAGIGTPRLVFAFDVGKAGTEYTRRYVARAIREGWTATAAQPRPEGETEKLDWNDLLVREKRRPEDGDKPVSGPGSLGPEDLANYLWNGAVLLAENATEKALLLWQRHGWSAFSFVHDSRTWWASFDEAKIAETCIKEQVKEIVAARACANVTEIANCAFQILYFQRDEATDESHYYMRVDFPSDAPTVKAPFPGPALTAGGEFKKRLLSVAPGAQWIGSTFQLDRMVAHQTRKIKRVQTLDFTGYSRDHGAWVLGSFAVQNGRVYQINDEDFFDLGKVQLKLRSPDRLLSIDYDAENFVAPWTQVIWQAFGGNGMVTLTFWIMSFFAEQIRKEQKSLAFIEMSGIPGTGKSTLIEFLWKLAGRENYEGFDPSKATPAALARNLARVSNMPVVFMEGDRNDQTPHSRKFDWDEIKALYNGRVVRSRGVKNNGNDTYEPPFRAALIIEQNYPVNASPAVMERIMHMTFTKEGWGADTKTAAEQLEKWPIEELSGTILHITKREQAWMEAYRASYHQHEVAFLKADRKVRNGRIRKNFAQLHAALDATALLLKLSAEMVKKTHAHIDTMAVARDRALEADHPMVAQFWETFDWLTIHDRAEDNDPHALNHSRNPNEIAVNLTHFEARCRREGVNSPPLEELKKHLKSSKSRPFVDMKTVNSRSEKHLHCWVFKTAEAAKASQKGAQ